MAKGNFSNGGQDTFDSSHHYIGIRLQQGVPLLDRDWNELEDIRRYFERMLRRHYIGQGVPGSGDFQITAGNNPNDFLIGAGRCMVNGHDLYNDNPIHYTKQPHRPEALSTPQIDEVLSVYLKYNINRIDSSDEEWLGNTQDINMETCLRDRLDWEVCVLPESSAPPLNSYLLANIKREARNKEITDAMIEDRRRTCLNLEKVVDTTENLQEMLNILESRIDDVQIDIEGIKQQLSRLFWDVHLDVSDTYVYFGKTVKITVTVTDGTGDMVEGAELSFSTDWGCLSPAMAVTNSQGKATIELIGVQADIPPSRGEVHILESAVEKVTLASSKNPGVIEYSKIRFQPSEMAIISKFSSPAVFTDLSLNLPTLPIVEVPSSRTSTVTVHAKEAKGAIVRGVGNIQIRFGMWVRDWARNGIFDIVSKVEVGTRIGELMTRGVEVKEGKKVFDYVRVSEDLPECLQGIDDDTQDLLKSKVLANRETSEEELTKSGKLGQVISQEATAAVGYKTNQAISQQLKKLTQDKDVKLDETGAKKAHTHLEQAASNITAGFTQKQKQRFSSVGLGV
jgi:hypothetical protein